MREDGIQNIKVQTFEEAVNCFLRLMRCMNFVNADKTLLRRYGDKMHTDVTAWCYKHGVTVHKTNGKLDLADKYKKATATIKIGKQKL